MASPISALKCPFPVSFAVEASVVELVVPLVNELAGTIGAVAIGASLPVAAPEYSAGPGTVYAAVDVNAR